MRGNLNRRPGKEFLLKTCLDLLYLFSHCLGCSNYLLWQPSACFMNELHASFESFRGVMVSLQSQILRYVFSFNLEP